MAKGCNALANGSAGGRADQGQIKLRHANYLSALGVDLKTTWMKDARCRQEIRRDATEAYPSHARALTATPQLFRPRQETRRPALIRDRCSTWRRRAIRSLRRGEIRPSFTAASVRYALWQAPPPPESLPRRRSRARDYVAVPLLAKPARHPGQEGHRALPPTRARDALARLALAPGSLSRFPKPLVPSD